MALTFIILFALLALPHDVASLPFNGIGVPIINTNAKDLIPGSYIVVYQNNATASAIASHQAAVRKAIKQLNGRSNTKTSASMNCFAINNLNGCSLRATDGIMVGMTDAPEVAYIEADTIFHAADLVSQPNAPTGLKRISHSAIGSNSYVFDSTGGSGITVYVLDSGINVDHVEFGGRATNAANFVNSVNTDEYGHGTHCAGTIGGQTYGVAKSATLVGVKILDNVGSGTTSAILAGINWVVNNVADPSKSVINLSIAGYASRAMNAAVNSAVNFGITTIVAAGNEGIDASADSPASAASAITVGAIDNQDTRASFSNFGAAVDLFAPGVSVQSAYIGSTTATKILSGTSMATPHVAGLSAYLMSLECLTTPSSILTRIKELAVEGNGTVKSAGLSSPTLIAYNGSGA